MARLRRFGRPGGYRINDTERPEHPVSKGLVRMWISKTFVVVPIRAYFLVNDEGGKGYRMLRRTIGVFGMDHDQSPRAISEAVRRRVELPGSYPLTSPHPCESRHYPTGIEACDDCQATT